MNITPPVPPAEIIVDERPMSGAFNMAMDEALLDFGAERNLTVVRIYRWSEPTVSVGYFQAADGRTEFPFPDLPAVRRLSGGGAILHDREVTYSCVLPALHPLRQDPSQLYEVIHRGLIALLQECGLRGWLRSELNSGPNARGGNGADPGSNFQQPRQLEQWPASTEPFLCFLRQNPNDIVVSSGQKIVGSAQRRRKGVTLQHGSILLSASDLIPSVMGIEQLADKFDKDRFSRGLASAIGASVSRVWTFRAYSETELQTSSKILERNSAAGVVTTFGSNR